MQSQCLRLWFAHLQRFSKLSVVSLEDFCVLCACVLLVKPNKKNLPWSYYDRYFWFTLQPKHTAAYCDTFPTHIVRTHNFTNKHTHTRGWFNTFRFGRKIYTKFRAIAIASDKKSLRQHFYFAFFSFLPLSAPPTLKVASLTPRSLDRLHARSLSLFSDPLSFIFLCVSARDRSLVTQTRTSPASMRVARFPLSICCTHTHSHRCRSFSYNLLRLLLRMMKLRARLVKNTTQTHCQFTSCQCE